jgi:hypothetical protein
VGAGARELDDASMQEIRTWVRRRALASGGDGVVWGGGAGAPPPRLGMTEARGGLAVRVVAQGRGLGTR